MTGRFFDATFVLPSGITPAVAAGVDRQCPWSPLRCECAEALPIPHRTDTCPAAGVGTGIRVLPGGVQRRSAGPRAGIPGRDAVVRHRDSAAGGHSGEDDRSALLAERGVQCGARAVSQRRAPGVAELLRLPVRQAKGQADRSATLQVEEGSPTVVSSHPQWIPDPAQRSAGYRESRSNAGALVARAAQRAVERHDHPRSRRQLLRELCCRYAKRPATGRRPAGGRGSRYRSVGDDRRHQRWAHRCAQPEVFAAQAAQTTSLREGEIPPRERIEQPEQDTMQGRPRSRRGGSCPAGPSPQAGPGAGSRQPSDPRRGPQHPGHGRQSPARTGNFGRRLGTIRADHQRESRTLRAHTTSRVPLAGIEQDTQRADTCSTSFRCGVRAWTCPTCGTTHDRDHNAAKVILAAGRAERINATHVSGRDRLVGSGGAPISPPIREVRCDEAGSSPTAA